MAEWARLSSIRKCRMNFKEVHIKGLRGDNDYGRVSNCFGFGFCKLSAKIPSFRCYSFPFYLFFISNIACFSLFLICSSGKMAAFSLTYIKFCINHRNINKLYQNNDFISPKINKLGARGKKVCVGKPWCLCRPALGTTVTYTLRNKVVSPMCRQIFYSMKWPIVLLM